MAADSLSVDHLSPPGGALLTDDELHVLDVDVDALVAERMISHATVQLPSTAERVVAAAAARAPLGELTKIVESDAELAASILRLASSPAFTGTAGERISLPYAVIRLGREGVRSVCLTASLAKVALVDGPLHALRRRVWRECLASALTCQAAAQARGLNVDDAYLAGLLHDIGKIAALLAIEADHPHITGPSDEAFWLEVVERHHCDAGWIMTDRWLLPEAVQAVTARHHLPSDGEPLHEVVQLVDAVVARAAQQGWQITAEEIAAMEGVRSHDEAMAMRIGLARHPYFFTAIA
ncbi:MAG: HDOD domain-containing protein [Deltaproteobacteria bacterium]|nr:HDOD domain-containing protein [Deltaproteobacteria bacterium]